MEASMPLTEYLSFEYVLIMEALHHHPLIGEWSDHRDCHIKPDLVLIYRKPNPKTLELVRLGSHSELGW
jgi:mRNA interferase YafQ